MGGVEKTEILRAFNPHIFFDDQPDHCEPASKVTPTGHVPAGIANQRKTSKSKKKQKKKSAKKKKK